MKVILSVESLSLQFTGVGRYTWELAQRLPKVLTDTDDLRFHHQQRWLMNPERLIQQPLSAVFPSQRLPLAIRNVRRYCLRTAWRKECKDWIFHGPNFFLPPYADKGVITLHDLSVLRFPELHPRERVKQYERSFRESLDRAQHLIAVSEATRQEATALLGINADKITVTHLAAGESYHPRTPVQTQSVLSAYGLTHGKYTLCVATLEPRKNIHVLIKAYALLPAAVRRHYPLVLVGGQGWLSEPIRKQIDAHQSEGWLNYLDFVSQAHLPEIYAGARSFAYLSNYEGFGLPVLEAMASGIPVVASNRSAVPEVTQGQGLHVDTDDIEAVTRALQKSLEDEPWRQTIIRAGLAVSKGYSWDNCILRTIAVYQKLV
jgi:alpha-1,3-rhamnosyl/mannosyltransferase